MGFRWWPYLAGHYLWILVGSIPLALTFEYQWVKSTGVIQSRSSPFKPLRPPTWFLHVSDVHLRESLESTYNTTRQKLTKALNVFQPRKLVITGDLVDSYWDKTLTHFRGQKREDWELYQRLLDELNLNPVQVAGNHDIYGVLSWDSSENFANGIVFNESNRIVGRVPFDDYEFVTINPYIYPTPPLSLLWNLFTGSKEKRVIEEAVESTEKDASLVLIGHHPAKMWFDWLSGFLSKTQKIRMYLSGHLHPPQPKFLHHGNVLEVVGTALKKTNQVGLVTIDNGEFVYHQMDLSKEKYGVLTYPVPDFQKTGHSSFTDVTEIRALAFGDNVTLMVDGGPHLQGKLNCSVELEKSVHLCVLPLSDVLSGEVTMKLNGDWDGTVTFTVGDEVGPLKEKLYKNEPTWEWIILLIIGIFGAVQLTIPIRYGTETAKAFDRWVLGMGTNSYWKTVIFGGILVVHHRITKAPMFLRIVLFVGFVWVLVLPSTIFLTEDKPSMFWTWGIVSGLNFQYNFLGARSAFFFLSGVLMPCCMATSALVMIRKSHFGSPVFFGDLLFYLGTFYGFYLNIDLITYIFGAAGFWSCVGVILPLIMHGCVLTFLVLTARGLTHNTQVSDDYSFVPSNEKKALLPSHYV